MPASRSASRAAKPPQPRSRNVWLIALIAFIGFVALLGVIVTVLPAAVVAHFLPPSVRAEDFSGSIWHGSAGKISVDARDAGALEWRLHPAALLGLTVSADLHWVKVGFVLDASATIDAKGFTAHAVTGGGPIEDLRDLGIAPGWHGVADVHLSELKGDFSEPLSAAGDLRVSNLSAEQIGQGADLGSYDLRSTEDSPGPDGALTAQLMDTGGPLEVRTLVRYSPHDRTGTISGTLRERPDAPQALRDQLENLSQLRGRDAQGRIPVDLEFRL